MTNTLTTIARTISEELERAVAAAEEAQNAGLDGVTNSIRSIVGRHTEAIEAAAELEREAAQLVSKAIKIRETALKDLQDALLETTTKVTTLKADPPRRIGGKKNKALEAPAEDVAAPEVAPEVAA